MDNKTKLVCALKTVGENLKYLHRNSSGKAFWSVHNKIEEYEELIANITDDVVELFLCDENFKEPTTGEAISSSVVESFSDNEYCGIHAMAMIQKQFNELIDCFEAVRNEVKNFIAARFDEYQCQLYKIANYLIAHFIKREDKPIEKTEIKAILDEPKRTVSNFFK